MYNNNKPVKPVKFLKIICHDRHRYDLFMYSAYKDENKVKRKIEKAYTKHYPYLDRIEKKLAAKAIFKVPASKMHIKL